MRVGMTVCGSIFKFIFSLRCEPFRLGCKGRLCLNKTYKILTAPEWFFKHSLVVINYIAHHPVRFKVCNSELRNQWNMCFEGRKPNPAIYGELLHMRSLF